MSRRRRRRQTEKPKRPVAARSRGVRRARSRPPGNPGQEARLHPHPGSTGARDQHLDLRAPHPPLHRDRADGLGQTLDPGRRARALPRRATATSKSRTAAACAARPQAWSPTRGRGPHPGRSAHRERASAGSRRTSTQTRCEHPRVAGSGGPRPCAPFSSARVWLRPRTRARCPAPASSGQRASSGYFLSRSERPNAADPAVACAPQLGLVTKLTAEDHTVYMGDAPRSCSPK